MARRAALRPGVKGRACIAAARKVHGAEAHGGHEQKHDEAAFLREEDDEVQQERAAGDRLRMPPSASNRPQVSQICSRWYVVGTQAMGSLAEDSPQPNRAQCTHARKSAKPMVSRQWADRFSRKRSIMRPSLVWRKYTGAPLPATVEVAHQQVPDQVKR